MDKVGWGFKSFRTLLVVASITFPILITFTLVHQNSVFDLVQGFNVLVARAHNASNVVLKQGTQNATTTTVIQEGAQSALKQGVQSGTVKTGGEKDHNIIPDSAPLGNSTVFSILELLTSSIYAFNSSLGTLSHIRNICSDLSKLYVR